MRQLELFGGGESPLEQSGPEEITTPTADLLLELAPQPPLDPRQVGLFEDRWLSAAAAQAAAERFDLDEAAEALRPTVDRFPLDDALRERARLIARLSCSLREATLRARSSLAGGLVAIREEVPSFLETAWHRRLAAAIESECGSGGALGTELAGLHWLQAQELEAAERSLRATHARAPTDARAQALLADALFLRGEHAQARAHYRDALARLPGDVDLARIVDPDVRELPAIAEFDYELPGSGIEWAAAVGVVLGTFESPQRARLEASLPDSAPAGVRFYQWLCQERLARSDNERIACRRAMKLLSAELLKRYLETQRIATRDVLRNPARNSP